MLKDLCRSASATGVTPCSSRSFQHFSLFVAGSASGNKIPCEGWIGLVNCFGAVNQNPLIAGAEGDTSFVAGSQIGFVASADRIVLCAESHHTQYNGLCQRRQPLDDGLSWKVSWKVETSRWKRSEKVRCWGLISQASNRWPDASRLYCSTDHIECSLF